MSLGFQIPEPHDWSSNLPPLLAFVFVIGHGIVLHGSDTVDEPKQFPPFLSSITFVRVLIRTPPPQDLEHGPKSQELH